jgi:hypothetical protein
MAVVVAAAEVKDPDFPRWMLTLPMELKFSTKDVVEQKDSQIWT